jgi:hypothetical protein
MKKFAEIINSFDSGLINGSVEGIKSIIQAAKARVRGYSIKYNRVLIVGKLVHLLRSPFKLATTTIFSERNAIQATDNVYQYHYDIQK